MGLPWVELETTHNLQRWPNMHQQDAVFSFPIHHKTLHLTQFRQSPIIAMHLCSSWSYDSSTALCWFPCSIWSITTRSFTWFPQSRVEWLMSNRAKVNVINSSTVGLAASDQPAFKFKESNQHMILTGVNIQSRLADSFHWLLPLSLVAQLALSSSACDTSILVLSPCG